MRRTIEALALEDVAQIGVVSEPIRISLPSPRVGGPPLGDVRKLATTFGHVRISGNRSRIFVDVDPGVHEPVVALDMIVRSDALGLERAILSALEEVDEIVIGVDGRSDDETHRIAAAFADKYHVFFAEDIGLSDSDWLAGKIHFANARNIGRKMVSCPWTLFLDSDEYIAETIDLRQLVQGSQASAFHLKVKAGAYEHLDVQRLALTRFRWERPSHNQLVMDAQPTAFGNTVIIHDTSLRTEEERRRREAQRREGVDSLEDAAKNGDLNAAYHIAKQKIGDGDLDAAVKWSNYYRGFAEPHGPLAAERALLAIGLAGLYFDREDFVQAELWAMRGLLDGPRVEAFCLLGDIAETFDRLHEARVWYEAACVCPRDKLRVEWTWLADRAHGRLAGIKRALAEGVTNGSPNGTHVPASEDQLPG